MERLWSRAVATGGHSGSPSADLAFSLNTCPLLNHLRTSSIDNEIEESHRVRHDDHPAGKRGSN
jgi:hypothetical protein